MTGLDMANLPPELLHALLARCSDWQRLILELRKQGRMRNCDIADEVEELGLPCSESAIADLSSGKNKEPRTRLGLRLLILHARVTTLPSVAEAEA